MTRNVGSTRGAARKKPSALKEADRLFSLIVRSRGVCEAAGTAPDCKGVLQCCHGFTRGYMSTRWDERHSFCMCAGHHKYFTHKPLQWDEWRREQWGDDLYRELRTLALSGVVVRSRDVLPRLRERWKQIEASV